MTEAELTDDIMFFVSFGITDTCELVECLFYYGCGFSREELKKEVERYWN